MRSHADQRSRTIATVAGFVLIWAVLAYSARRLGSLRGEWGLLIAPLVVIAALAVEKALDGRPLREALRALGFGRPTRTGMAAGGAVILLLFAAFSVYATIAGTEMALRQNWGMLALGLLAQGGIAEETLFRGYLHRRLREGRSFRHAAGLSTLGFAAAHLPLFFQLSPEVAGTALLLAVALSFPLAWLFEIGGGTVWLPAVLHFVVQGTLKLLEISDTTAGAAAVAWMGLAAVVPFLVFAFRPASAPAPLHQPH